MEEDNKFDTDEKCYIPNLERRSIIHKNRVNPLLSDKGKQYESDRAIQTLKYNLPQGKTNW